MRRAVWAVADGVRPDSRGAGGAADVPCHIQGGRSCCLHRRRGGGSFDNHAKQPNAERVLLGSKTVLRTLRSIRRGDEIYLSYGSQVSREEALRIKWGCRS